MKDQMDVVGRGFDWYQYQAKETAFYPRGYAVVYPALGLAGEAGEVCEKIKKALRDNNGNINDEWRKDIAKELGDVLWYLSQLAEDLSLSFGDVAILNLEKLQSRQERGKLQGEGDNR